MFEDEYAILSQQIAAKNQLHDLLAAFQVVGCIRKDHIELLGTALQVTESIGFDRIKVLESELFGGLPDKIVVDGVDFDGGNAARSPRCEFVADRSGAGEEIQYVARLEIHVISQYIEQILLGEIRRGSRSEIPGRIDASTLEFSADYSHNVSLNRFPISFPSARVFSPARNSVYFFVG